MSVREAFAKYPTPRLPYEWALRHVLDRQEVSLVLSGMGTVNQIWENAAIASSAEPNTLTAPERKILDEARELYLGRMRVSCTSCGYCQPCPSGVKIPEVFGLYNQAAMFDSRKSSGFWYKDSLSSKGAGAEACARCGECLSKCPQGIAIPDRLEEAHAYLSAD